MSPMVTVGSLTSFKLLRIASDFYNSKFIMVYFKLTVSCCCFFFFKEYFNCIKFFFFVCNILIDYITKITLSLLNMQ